MKSNKVSQEKLQLINNETIILVWNDVPKYIPNNCLQSDLFIGLDRSYPNYPNLSPNFKCPFDCTLTRERDL